LRAWCAYGRRERLQIVVDDRELAAHVKCRVLPEAGRRKSGRSGSPNAQLARI